MGQATLHVGQSREEDRIRLMVMVRLEDELVPRLVRLPGLRRLAELQELVQGFSGVRRPQHGLLQVRRPVGLRGPDQDIWRRESDMVIDQTEQRRAKPDVPEFSRLAPVARSNMAGELVIRDQFPQPKPAILDPNCS